MDWCVFCIAYVPEAELLLKDVDLHMWQRCKMVFSFLSRWGLAKVREECDERLVRCLGVEPALRHRPETRHRFHTSRRCGIQPSVALWSCYPLLYSRPLSQGRSLTEFLALVSG